MQPKGSPELEQELLTRETGHMQEETPWSSERVIDCHFHERTNDEATIAHLDGAGITSALVLAFGDFRETYGRLREKEAGRIVGWARAPHFSKEDVYSDDPHREAFDMTETHRRAARGEALSTLAALKADGWKGFAETTGRVAVDSPELQCVYAISAELDVPVMMHFQEAEVPGQPVYGIKGFSRIGAMLEKFPATKFVCHAPDFWGNIDSRYHDGGAYLSGPVARGGLSDRLLRDYPNMYGDLGAPSALLQLTRDLDFTADFLERHREKLMFGSDCGCTDGRGGLAEGAQRPTAPLAPAPKDQGVWIASTAAAMQTAMASLGGLAGKCIGRELLSVTWRTTSRETFRRIAADNAVRAYNLT
ncbi:amidohydrolase family protein [Sinomonas humi]|uniref:amidohydrolase family protein n=1 Tax=Sinomonas humi TaxID=1338436 RepID=UPI00068DA053|nr:hypothetical protein [Sinomonas humi]